MVQVKNFNDLVVWQKSHLFFIELNSDIKKFPTEKTANIIATQIIRSAASISANIAEGFNASSTKEYIHYLDIALRTTAETENWYYKIKDLKYLDENICSKRCEQCIEIRKMLFGLIKSLRNKQR